MNKVPMPERFEPTNWDKVFDRIIGFTAWQAKWNKVREAQVKKNHEPTS